MARYRTPDALVCLGGAGRAIGETFMTQAWILNEVMDNDPRDDAPDDRASSTRSLDAFFIDTDRTSGSGIEDDVESLVDEIADGMSSPPRPKAKYINLVEETNQSLLTADELLNRTRVNQIAEETGMAAWWLLASDDVDSDTDMIDPLGDFKGGVVRRRGLTKAIHRASQYDQDPLGQVVTEINASAGTDVAMIVGLGGGTGSGLFLDLAYRIRDETDANLTLFAVLPAPSGRDQNTELANTYAALSELEYLALNDRNLFRNILLFPLEPARDLDAFDVAATYAITSFYNLSNGQENTYAWFDETERDGPPKFAPFTLAVPRYLHYPKKDIDETRENFNNYVEQKQDALEAEEELYEQLTEFIEDNYPEAAAHLQSTPAQPAKTYRLESANAIELRNHRLEPLRTLLAQDFIKEFEFRSARKLLERIEDVETEIRESVSPADEDDRTAAITRELFERLPRAIDDPSAFESSDNGGWVSGEEEFAQLVVDEIEMIALRAGLLRAADVIEDEADDEAVAEDIRRALSPGSTGIVTEVEAEIERLDLELDELSEQLAAVEDVEAAAETERDRLVSEWDNGVKDDLDEYYTLVESKDRIEHLFRNLRKSLKELKTEAEEAWDNLSSAEYIRPRGPEFDEYAELNRLLERTSCRPVDEDKIKESTRGMLNACKAKLKAIEREGTVRERVLSQINGGTIPSLHGEYQHARNHRIDTSILTITDWDDQFEVTIKEEYFENRLQHLQERKEELLEQLLETTEDQLDAARRLTADPKLLTPDDELAAATIEAMDVPSDDANRYWADLEPTLANSDWGPDVDTSGQLRRTLEADLIDDLMTASLIEPFQQLHKRTQDELSAKSDRREQLDRLDSIVGGEGRHFADMDGNVTSVSNISEYRDPEEGGPFKIEITPSDRGLIGQSEDLGETPLWNTPELGEQATIARKLLEMVPKFGSEFVPINETTIATREANRPTYEGFRAHSVFMSRLFDGFADDDTARIDEVTEQLTGYSAITEGDNYEATRGTFAGPWDVAMTTFLTGVFLDNLKLFTNECRSAYENHADIKSISVGRHNPQPSVPGTVMRHTYGIDGRLYHTEPDFFPDDADGAFPYRSDVINVGLKDDRLVLLQAERVDENAENVAETLLEEYYQRVGFPSTIDLGGT